jgi:hypothetical protein
MLYSLAGVFNRSEMELAPAARRIRDFYFKEALAAPGDVTFVHRAGLVPDPRLFSLERLRGYINDPLFDLNYLNVFHEGKAVDLEGARVYKVVQRRKIAFVDRRVLQHYFERGAACVLEGLDILEPDINALAAALDRAQPATFTNATAFFSQRGNEAYRGHLDTDDVLVVHVAGEKRWRIHARQAPRRVGLTDLDERQMGEVAGEVVMRPGDVLYIRSFAPHRVTTLSPCSLHVSFDLCDRQPSIELALQLLLKHYDRDSSPRLVPPREDLDKVFRLSKSAAYEGELAQVQAAEKAGFADFRDLIANNRVTHLDRFVANAEPLRPEASAGLRRP